MQKKTQKALWVMPILALALTGALMAAPKAKSAEKKKTSGTGDDVFVVFTERGSRLNHYIPSGWMGDYGDLSFNQGWKDGVQKSWAKDDKRPKDPNWKDETCLQVKYTAQRKQGAGWAGIYWQHPANNWGDKRGGNDLSGYTKLTFWAKGAKGGEVVDKFFMGGITGQTEEGDSDEASISPVTLTKDWKKYTVSLAGLDLRHIIGGFGMAANADANPDGFIIFIDEIYYEK